MAACIVLICISVTYSEGVWFSMLMSSGSVNEWSPVGGRHGRFSCLPVMCRAVSGLVHPGSLHTSTLPMLFAIYIFLR